MNLTELLIPILVFLAAAAVCGLIVVVPRAIRRRAIHPRLFEAGAGGEGAVDGGSATTDLLNRIGAKVGAGRTSEKLRQDLARAGFSGKSAPDIYVGAKLVLLIVGVVGALAATLTRDMPLATKVALACGAGGVLSFMPNLVVASHRRKRSTEVRNYLPDATDLLEICVSSGMGLDQAWIAVADEIRRVSPTLADEMALTNLEIQLGAPRPDAMRHMAERTGAEELGSLVAVLLQSERFGTSIADALKEFAQSMRETRSARAEESAEKMAVKLLIPMVLFVFPAMLIVMVGPAAVRLVSVMGR